MASEILAVPEENLEEVIAIVRAGLAAIYHKRPITRQVQKQLKKWCDEMEEYLKQR